MTQPGDQIGDAELSGFLAKLDTWADALNVGEKALLQLVLERASGRSGGDEGIDLSFPATAGFGDVVAPFLREIVSSASLSVRAPGDDGGEDIEDLEASEQDADLVRGGMVMRSWVEAGDPWLKSVSALF